MAACPACGALSADTARFCADCGEPLATATNTSRQSRRTVTILFSDLVGSTALGESQDPETVRAVVERYFAQMEGVIGNHGGRVEKFIGDAIMAVFGLPVLHDDDAVRAARAALRMQAELEQLNEETESAYGIRLDNRTGLATGEVVAALAAGARTLVTGDAVNTAARLEQAAQPGRILVSGRTAQLIDRWCHLERLDPISVKGKSVPVDVFRLVDLIAADVEPSARRRPLIGRAEELRHMLEAVALAHQGGQPWILNVTGPAGIGKSHLTEEFAARTASGNLNVVRARCDPYGQASSYAPLRQLVCEMAGIGDGENGQVALERLIEALGLTPNADQSAVRLARAAGYAAGPVVADEIHLDTRRLFEATAAHRQVLCIIEDIHWATRPMLQLIDHVGRFATGPIVIACTARPDLLDSEWRLSGERRSAVLVTALQDESINQLIEATAAGEVIEVGLRNQIIDTASGNPLFAEEMVRLWLANRGSVASVPPTIQAIIETRMDHLPERERLVAQHGAVVGHTFTRAALGAIAQDDAGAVNHAELDAALEGLVHHEVIDLKADGSSDEYRFRHALIRDAAYGSLAKRERATLHETFANKLATIPAGPRGSQAEVVALHLERAFLLRSELGDRGEQMIALGATTATYLAVAARAAADVGNALGAADLLKRSIELPGVEPREAVIRTVDLVNVLLDTRLTGEALDYARRAVELSQERGAEGLTTRARVALASVEYSTEEDSASDKGRADVDSCVAEAVAASDVLAMAMAHLLRSGWRYLLGDLAGAAADLELGLAEASAAGDRVLQLAAEDSLLTVALVGPMPASQVIDLARTTLDRLEVSQPLRMSALRILAVAEAMGGNPQARHHMAQSRQMAEDLRRDGDVLSLLFDGGWVEHYCGDDAAAEEMLRSAISFAARIGDPVMDTYARSRLAPILVDLARNEDALAIVSEAGATTLPSPLSRLLGARARATAERDGALALADVATMMGVVADSPFVIVRADANYQAGEVFNTLGDRGTAAEHWGRAAEIYRAKGIARMTARIEARLVSA